MWILAFVAVVSKRNARASRERDAVFFLCMIFWWEFFNLDCGQLIQERQVTLSKYINHETIDVCLIILRILFYYGAGPADQRAASAWPVGRNTLGVCRSCGGLIAAPQVVYNSCPHSHNKFLCPGKSIRTSSCMHFSERRSQRSVRRRELPAFSATEDLVCSVLSVKWPKVSVFKR